MQDGIEWGMALIPKFKGVGALFDMGWSRGRKNRFIPISAILELNAKIHHILCIFSLSQLQVAANFRVIIASIWLRGSQHTTPNGVISQQLRDNVPSFRMTKISIPPTDTSPRRPLS